MRGAGLRGPRAAARDRRAGLPLGLQRQGAADDRESGRPAHQHGLQGPCASRKYGRAFGCASREARRVAPTRPSPPWRAGGEKDIVDEAIYYFKANVFFKNYEIKGDADRVLVYLTLYISQCLGRLQKCANANEASKAIATLAIENFSIPGDKDFPMNQLYAKPPRATQTT